jgi:serine/threonine protein kinase
VVVWATQLASGLDAMEKTDHIGHCDLKPENILLHHSEPSPTSHAGVQMIIGDLGCALYRFKAELTGAAIAANLDMAHVPPEAKFGVHDHKTDMWAFGVCLHMLAFKKWRCVDEKATCKFYRDLSVDKVYRDLSAEKPSKPDFEAELKGMYKSAEGGMSDSALRSYKAIATVLTHTIWPHRGMRWSAEQVLAELKEPEPDKVGRFPSS